MIVKKIVLIILIREVADRERALAYFLREQECKDILLTSTFLLISLYLHISIQTPAHFDSHILTP